jgi:hypothetical protein
VNPGAARLAIVIALVIGGVVVLANGFGDEESRAAPPGSTPSPSASPTPSPSRTPQETVTPNQEGVLVQVLNGTSTAGAAADFQEVLEQDRYLPAGDAADAPDKPVLDTIVYFRRDDNRQQNRADAGLLSDTYLDGAAVEPLPASLADPSVTSEAADVIVVLGEDLVDQL